MKQRLSCKTIVGLPETQDLSAVMATYHSRVENIENTLNDLDELEESVKVDF